MGSRGGAEKRRRGNAREAAQFYQGAIDIDQDSVGARAGLGRLYLRAGAPNQALATVQPSLDKHPDDPGLLTVRAAARDLLKNLPGALADAEHAVHQAPNNEDAVSVLAGIEQGTGQSDQAVSLLTNAIKQLPPT